MRKYIALALTAGLLTVPAALAGQGSGDSGHKGKGEPAHVAKVHLATFEFTGTVAAVGADTITIAPIRAHGSRSRAALAGAVTFTVKLDAKTRITRSEMGRVSMDRIMIGDRVKAEIRAPRGTALADMPAAKRIKLKATEASAPAPAPDPVPAPAPDPMPSPTQDPVVAPPATETAPPPPPMIGF